MEGLRVNYYKNGHFLKSIFIITIVFISDLPNWDSILFSLPSHGVKYPALSRAHLRYLEEIFYIKNTVHIT